MADGVTNAIETTARIGDPAALVFRFLNNNDTGPRFITTRGVDCYRVAAAMLLTLPGLPCVYNGDEVGAEFLPYDDVAIDWTDRHGLRDHFTRLIALRVQQPALHSREWMPLPVEPARPLFGYLRYRAAGGSPVLVLLNVSPAELDATVPLPDAFAGILGRGELTDLYARERIRVAVADHLTVPMPAWGIRILVPEGSDRDRERCITAQPTARPP